jgi:hypothetical protein
MLFCSSATNRLITSKDHASVQINIGHLDASGHYTGQFTTFALCGFVRAQVFFLLLFFLPRIRNLLWFFWCSLLKRSLFIVCYCCCCWFFRFFLISLDKRFQSREMGSVWIHVDGAVVALEHGFFGLRF